MSTLKVNSIIPTGGVPTGGGGGIVQVKTATKTDAFTSTSTSFVDITGLSVDMTLAKSTHKVLIRYDILCGGDYWTSGPAYLSLVADSTRIGIGTAGADANSNVTTFHNLYANNQNNSTYNVATQTATFLYTPGDTSSHTYKVQGRMQNSSSGFSINRRWQNADRSTISTLTLMEVSA
tara:strand:- start:26 stop:559 length:534 start_codon:yes stop_codon:yes gene_type:complete